MGKSKGLSKKKKGLIIGGAIFGVVAIGVGVAVPLVLDSSSSNEKPQQISKEDKSANLKKELANLRSLMTTGNIEQLEDSISKLESMIEATGVASDVEVVKTILEATKEMQNAKERITKLENLQKVAYINEKKNLLTAAIEGSESTAVESAIESLKTAIDSTTSTDSTVTEAKSQAEAEITKGRERISQLVAALSLTEQINSINNRKDLLVTAIEGTDIQEIQKAKTNLQGVIDAVTSNHASVRTAKTESNSEIAKADARVIALEEAKNINERKDLLATAIGGTDVSAIETAITNLNGAVTLATSVDPIVTDAKTQAASEITKANARITELKTLQQVNSINEKKSLLTTAIIGTDIIKIREAVTSLTAVVGQATSTDTRVETAKQEATSEITKANTRIDVLTLEDEIKELENANTAALVRSEIIELERLIKTVESNTDPSVTTEIELARTKISEARIRRVVLLLDEQTARLKTIEKTEVAASITKEMTTLENWIANYDTRTETTIIDSVARARAEIAKADATLSYLNKKNEIHIKVQALNTAVLGDSEVAINNAITALEQVIPETPDSRLERTIQHANHAIAAARKTDIKARKAEGIKNDIVILQTAVSESQIEGAKRKLEALIVEAKRITDPTTELTDAIKLAEAEISKTSDRILILDLNITLLTLKNERLTQAEFTEKWNYLQRRLITARQSPNSEVNAEYEIVQGELWKLGTTRHTIALENANAGNTLPPIQTAYDPLIVRLKLPPTIITPEIRSIIRRANNAIAARINAIHEIVEERLATLNEVFANSESTLEQRNVAIRTFTESISINYVGTPYESALSNAHTRRIELHQDVRVEELDALIATLNSSVQARYSVIDIERRISPVQTAKEDLENTSVSDPVVQQRRAQAIQRASEAIAIARFTIANIEAAEEANEVVNTFESAVDVATTQAMINAAQSTYSAAILAIEIDNMPTYSIVNGKVIETPATNSFRVYQQADVSDAVYSAYTRGTQVYNDSNTKKLTLPEA